MRDLHRTDDSGTTVTLADENATLAYARRLSVVLQPGLVVYLHGNLGAGKTTLVRGLLNALGHSGRVKSPTYTLLEPYRVGDKEIRHFDLYRMTSADEWEQAGFGDEIDGNNICLIEWPEQAQGHLPPADLQVKLTILAQGRAATLQAFSPKGSRCIQQF